MSKLPQLKANKVVKALTKLGFEKTRHTGSHLRMVHPDGRATTIPIHSATLPKGTLKSILRQTKVTIEELKAKM